MKTPPPDPSPASRPREGAPARAPAAPPAAAQAAAPAAAAQAAAPPADDPTRQRLLDAARDLFTARGFRGTSTRAIAAAAGCNLSLIKYYFGSKEGLLRAVMQPQLNQVRFLIEGLNGDDTPSPDRIRRFFLDMARQIDTNRDFFRLIFAELLREETFLGAELLEQVVQNQQAGLRTLQRARDAGVLRDVDLRIALLMVIGPLLFYHLGYPLTSRLAGPRSPELVEHMAQTAADIFLNGTLRRRPGEGTEVLP